MSSFNQLVLIVFTVVLILAAITLLGEFLRSKLSPNGENKIIDRFVLQTEGWWAAVVALSLAFLTGRIGVIIFFFLISFGAMREFLTFTAKRRSDHLALIIAYYLFLPLQYVFIFLGWHEVFTLFIPVYGFFILAIAQAFKGDTDNFLARVAETQWGVMVTVYSISYVAALMTLEFNETAGGHVLLIIYLLIVTQLSDIFQYWLSFALKGRKLAPRLMPTRTWPGVLAGGVSAALIGGLLFWMTPFSFISAFFISLLLCVLGFFGSVVMRAIKRDRGIRKWGHMIAGYGGLVDRLDALIFAAPIYYSILYYIYG